MEARQRRRSSWGSRVLGGTVLALLWIVGCRGGPPPDLHGRLEAVEMAPVAAMQEGILAYLRVRPKAGGESVVVEVRRVSEVIGKNRRAVAVSILEPGALVDVWFAPNPEPPAQRGRVARRVVLVRPASMPRPPER